MKKGMTIVSACLLAIMLCACTQETADETSSAETAGRDSVSHYSERRIHRLG